ncbi:MAG: 2-C-methyl-D-erythritol 2,4-cyclodiphosphate synthase [Gaiellales bacterium]
MTEELRVGIGVDAHALAPGRPLVLAGVTIPSAVGLVGHSDGDLVCHAAADALLGAAGGADIGELFGSDDPSLAGASSLGLLRDVWQGLAGGGWRLVNLDTVVILQEPRLAPHRDAMRRSLADALSVDVERITVRATTTDRLGFAGRGEGAACQAAALLARDGR